MFWVFLGTRVPKSISQNSNDIQELYHKIPGYFNNYVFGRCPQNHLSSVVNCHILTYENA